MPDILSTYPLNEPIVGTDGKVTEPWANFFRDVFSALNQHIGAGGDAHALVTTTVAGFMSAADKVKLDGL